MALTTKQRADVSRLRYQCYREEAIAEKLDISLADVRSVSRRGRPKKAKPTPNEDAQSALLQALAKPAVSERFKAVKCVLANFGDLLGYGAGDAQRLIDEYLVKKTA